MVGVKLKPEMLGLGSAGNLRSEISNCTGSCKASNRCLI